MEEMILFHRLAFLMGEILFVILLLIGTKYMNMMQRIAYKYMYL